MHTLVTNSEPLRHEAAERYVDSQIAVAVERTPEYVCEAEARLHALDACNAKCFDEIPIHGMPDVQILQTLFEFAEQFLVSASGSTVSPRNASFNIACQVLRRPAIALAASSRSRAL